MFFFIIWIVLIVSNKQVRKLQDASQIKLSGSLLRQGYGGQAVAVASRQASKRKSRRR